MLQSPSRLFFATTYAVAATLELAVGRPLVFEDMDWQRTRDQIMANPAPMAQAETFKQAPPFSIVDSTNQVRPLVSAAPRSMPVPIDTSQMRPMERQQSLGKRRGDDRHAQFPHATAQSAPSPSFFQGSNNPFTNDSPRLPSFQSFYVNDMRPPPLSLRTSSDVSDSWNQEEEDTRQSTLATSTTPPHSVGLVHSQSLPGVSYLNMRQRSSSTSSVSEDDGALGLLSSASSANTAALRTGRLCRYANCNNIARSRGLCRTHGGGKRCSHPNCTKSAQANRKCIAHGGGTPCSYENCDKTAQSRGLCKAHGGGARCKHPDCPKSSQSRGLCRGHGGGIKCKVGGCDKWVQKNGYCIKHGRENSLN